MGNGLVMMVSELGGRSRCSADGAMVPQGEGLGQWQGHGPGNVLRPRRAPISAAFSTTSIGLSRHYLHMSLTADGARSQLTDNKRLQIPSPDNVL